MAKPVPPEQRATEKLQIYVTPYTLERLEARKAKTGKAISVIGRHLIEEGLGLRERSRAKINRKARIDPDRDRLEERVRELIAGGSSPAVARRVAAAEQRLTSPEPPRP